jgi:hypothetical protein
VAQPDGGYADRISVPPEDDGPLEPLPPKWSEYEKRVSPHLQELADQRVVEGLPDPLLRDVPPGELGYVPHRVEVPEAVMAELTGPDVTQAHDPGQPEEYAGADVPDPWAEPAAGVS